jgi:ferredoxin-nitrite reductase
VPTEAIAPRPLFDRAAHIGAHPQKQKNLYWLGVVLPVGRLTCAQMRGIAAIAQQMGDGDIRLTVWQNLLISGIPAGKLEAAEAAIDKLGLTTRASSVRAGLVACTGNVGCRFSASDTKRHAEEIAQWCEARVAIDSPVNIHLTGCHHSCAQHYIGDIGLLACKVQTSDDGEAIEGYHVHVGGGFGPDAALGREICRDVTAGNAPRIVERLLRGYLAHRASPDETFLTFARRHEVEQLKHMAEAEAAE